MFLLPPGYKIEPVLADPLIEDPVGVTFDGNGRMYVLEMRSYMQDADGSDARASRSAASRATRTPTATASTTSTRCSPTSW